MSASDKKQPEPRLVIRTKEGEHYGIPLSHLAKCAVAGNAIVLQWAPGRYAVVPREQMKAFRLTDDQLMRFMVQSPKSRRRGRSRFRMGLPR